MVPLCTDLSLQSEINMEVTEDQLQRVLAGAALGLTEVIPKPGVPKEKTVAMLTSIVDLLNGPATATTGVLWTSALDKEGLYIVLSGWQSVEVRSVFMRRLVRHDGRSVSAIGSYCGPQGPGAGGRDHPAEQ